MEQLLIRGGNPLFGEVKISGAKNSAVAIIPATILAGGLCNLDNIPNINDIYILKEMLESMGAKVSLNNEGIMSVDTTTLTTHEALQEEAKRMRASYYLLGALLGRCKKAAAPYPGGCDIGNRPIDQHIKGFEAMGATVKVEHGIIKVEAEKLTGASIFLDVVSVGATINIMLAAVLAEGVTTIENAAKEPHIVDVANFLNSMGAKVKGAGTDIIKITGVESLRGCDYSIIPDQIEAGTFMIAAAVSGGDVTISNIIPKHMEPLTAKLIEMGITVEEMDDKIRVACSQRPKRANIKTLPYPGFPTDLQQPMGVLLSLAEGTSVITESIWEGRFKYLDELKRMGGKSKIEGRVAIIEGVETFSGATVLATDLRAGAALVVAGLVADGETYVGNIHYIDRGYEFLEDKLVKLGADIRRVKGQ
jgi:UDP-N-acetylglucosamine 1-carboxyvinyltransferase